MKITDSNLNGISTPSQQGVQPASTGAGTHGASRTGEGRLDRVQLSDLSSAIKSLSAGSPERSARVDELAAAYNSGQFSVDSAAVSSSMVNDALGAH